MSLVSVAAPMPIGALPDVGPAALTMGVFDGVHIGHRRLLEATRSVASDRAVASVAIVFDPPPIEVLRPEVRLARLGSLHANLELIAAAGIEHPLPLRFDDALRELSADAFIAALGPSIELRALVMTPQSAFGHNRGGTPDAMRELGARRGFEVVVAEPLIVDGEAVSSSRIRQAIERGDLALGARLLGHRPALRGMVVSGDRRGRELGFPTANLAFAYHPALPPLGIYAGRASVPERGVGPGHPALISVGVRPTFHDEGRLLVEVYLLDFDGDLYDAELTVELDVRLREERRFDSVPALIEQMRQDERDARRFLRGGT
jgi:riboflavin kinase / FMN adenylyltransferase